MSNVNANDLVMLIGEQALEIRLLKEQVNQYVTKIVELTPKDEIKERVEKPATE